MYYGKHKKDGSLGFFLDTEYCTDFVEITDAEHSRLISEQEKGKQIIRGDDGYPAAVAPDSLLTEEEKKERAAESIRNKRNTLLAETDKFMLTDMYENLTPREQKELKDYRQYLRDIPQTSDFPDVEVMSLADYKRL